MTNQAVDEIFEVRHVLLATPLDGLIVRIIASRLIILETRLKSLGDWVLYLIRIPNHNRSFVTLPTVKLDGGLVV